MPDTTPPDTSVRIRALLPTLAPAERRVAERVLADPRGVAALTISTLARDCETSETTVIRFCRAVGFAGYPALRLALAAEAGRSGGDVREPFANRNVSERRLSFQIISIRMNSPRR